VSYLTKIWFQNLRTAVLYSLLVVARNNWFSCSVSLAHWSKYLYGLVAYRTQHSLLTYCFVNVLSMINCNKCTWRPTWTESQQLWGLYSHVQWTGYKIFQYHQSRNGQQDNVIIIQIIFHHFQFTDDIMKNRQYNSKISQHEKITSGNNLSFTSVLKITSKTVRKWEWWHQWLVRTLVYFPAAVSLDTREWME